MRIIAGKHKGRAITTGWACRAPDKRPCAESLFNILEHRDHGPETVSILNDAIVLDVFAGSGALGLEALSRGAHFHGAVSKLSVKAQFKQFLF